MTWWAALASAGIGALSNRRASKQAAKEADKVREAQEEANAENLEEAARNRGFQKDMSDTSYQRVVEDMKAAGINPMLASKTGGASTPGGSAGSVQNTEEGASNVRTAAFNAKIQALNSLVNMENVRASSAKTQAETAKIEAETPGVAESIAETKSRTELNKAQMNVVNESVAKVKADTNLANAKAFESSAAWNHLQADSQFKLASRDTQIAMTAKVIQETANVSANTARQKAETVILKYNASGARRESEHAEGAFGGARPWLRDLGEALNSAGKARNIFR